MGNSRGESFIHKTNEILINKKRMSENELLIADMEGFLVSLRGFPWGKNADCEFLFILILPYDTRNKYHLNV